MIFEDYGNSQLDGNKPSMLNELIDDIMSAPVDKALGRLGSYSEGKAFGIPFDQDAGTMLGFMGQERSCTTLPDFPHGKYMPNIYFARTRLAGFRQSRIEV